MEKEEELKRQLEEQLTTDGESKTDDEEDGEEGKDKDDKKNNTN
jgi:hypothetical protein